MKAAFLLDVGLRKYLAMHGFSHENLGSMIGNPLAKP
jgi:hypothetical protein